jgi:molybdate transport system ATP-binding protein
MLEITIGHRVRSFHLDVSIRSDARVLGLFGPSGAGKSTVLNAIAGVLRPEGGRIVIGDVTFFDSALQVWTPPHLRRIGYVFQDGRLFPHLSVEQNLRFGSWFARAALPTVDFDRVVALLGLEELLARKPGKLSGGEAQRVAIGRALLASPRLLLMDEPLSALDAARRQEILPYIERLRDEFAIPIIYVSHTLAEIERLADKIVELSGGRVVAQTQPSRRG